MKMPDTPLRAPHEASLADLEDHGAFRRRHIGPDDHDEAAMLATLGFDSRAALPSLRTSPKNQSVSLFCL